MKYVKIINKNFYFIQRSLKEDPFFKTDFWGFEFKNVYIEVEDHETIDLNLIKKIYLLKFSNFFDFVFLDKLEKNKNFFDDYFDIQILNLDSKIVFCKYSILINKDQYFFDKIFYRNQYKYNYLYHAKQIKKSKKDFQKKQKLSKINLDEQILKIRKDLEKYFNRLY